jgi:hypothetical protein
VVEAFTVLSTGFEGSRFPKLMAALLVLNLQLLLDNTAAVTETIVLPAAQQTLVSKRIENKMATPRKSFILYP